MEMKDVLIQLREEHELKQADIADLLNVVSSTVSKYERGKSFPEHDGLIKLADFYNVNLDYLFGRTTIKTPIKNLEKKLKIQNSNIPIDFIFQLNDEDRKLIYLLLKSISQKPNYNI